MEVDDKSGLVIAGRYRLEEVIGVGTMSVVYRGTQLAVGRPVAIKVLNASVEHQPKLQQRFEREAQAVARVNHPNIVTIHDFGYFMDADLLYMVLELVEGDALTEVLDADIGVQDALNIAFQTANAIAHAHASGVSHRDLKPSNVMLAREPLGDRVKVLDFGMAKVYESAGDQFLGPSDVYGAPGYVAPEQLVGDIAVGPPADVYSLGCLMYRMFDGEPPYGYSTPSDMLQAHVSEPPPEVSNDAVPPEVAALTKRLLTKAPEGRPTAEIVIAELRPFVDLDPGFETQIARVTAREPAAVSTSAERVIVQTQPAGSNAIYLVIIAALAILCAVFAFMAFS